MQRCFFFSQCSIGTVLAKLSEIRGEKKVEDCWILCPYFNVPLMCEWMQIKICQLFSPECIACCSSTKWQWSGIEQMMILHTVYHFGYFPGPLNCPMFYLKASNTFTLIHRNLVHFSPFLCLRTKALVVLFSQFWCHIPPGALHAVRNEAVSWPGCGVPVK